MDGMLIIGTLVNVDNDTYLEEVVNKTLYLMKFMLTAWGKNQQETEFTCVAKRRRYVLVSIR
jgi:hypothetical protein